METITKRETQSGTVYTARVRLKRVGKLVHGAGKKCEKRDAAVLRMKRHEGAPHDERDLFGMRAYDRMGR
ncbi:hypothetical protein [Caballeronia sp. LZ035]|uniref:hypothetical protein n=1 Tax=Caballeronia sp. LZ035 TaxID=3038568 RepID=UPI002856C3CF|nr:hypothetical protein [Caballeronia sp. LZ035]MDR5762582.1 hypothetical protein [Caballeronia sp. LZ035]